MQPGQRSIERAAIQASTEALNVARSVRPKTIACGLHMARTLHKRLARPRREIRHSCDSAPISLDDHATHGLCLWDSIAARQHDWEAQLERLAHAAEDGRALLPMIRVSGRITHSSFLFGKKVVHDLLTAFPPRASYRLTM